MIRVATLFGVKDWQTFAALWAGALSCKKKISTAERSWTDPSNGLQEVIHYSFIKFCIYFFSLRYEFFVHYILREKKYQLGLGAGPLEFQFLRPRGCLTNPFRTMSLCFGVIGKTPKHQVSSPVIILLKIFYLHWPSR